MRLIVPFVSGLLMAASTGAASAALTLHVDYSTSEFWFSGSDSGTPFSPGPTGGVVRWESPAGGTGIDSSSAIDEAALDVGLNSYSGISRVSSYEDKAFVEASLGSADSTTFTGTTAKVSYAGWASEDRTYLESLDGQSLPVLLGNGYSELQITVVPEPGSMIFGAIGLGCLLCSRRR